MANKFQRSVLERLEMEQEQKKQEQAEQPEPKAAPKAKKEPTEKPAAPKQKPPAPKEPAALPVPDLSVYLQKAPARQAKNKTFYLDVEVIEAIKAAAAAQGIADSKLVNDILRHILLQG